MEISGKDVHSQLGLDPGEKFFIVVGRLRRVKDPGFVIRPFHGKLCYVSWLSSPFRASWGPFKVICSLSENKMTRNFLVIATEIGGSGNERKSPKLWSSRLYLLNIWKAQSWFFMLRTFFSYFRRERHFGAFHFQLDIVHQHPQSNLDLTYTCRDIALWTCWSGYNCFLW